MEITVFSSDKQPQGMRRTLTWEELVETLREPAPKSEPKSSLKMWSPATFVGDYRKAENTEQVSAMVFDVDEDPVPSLETIGETLKGFRWFAHSSSSSTLEKPRWRLILSLSRPVTAEEHGTLWRTLADGFGFPVGAASKDSSRSWYAPREGKDGSYVCS